MEVVAAEILSFHVEARVLGVSAELAASTSQQNHAMSLFGACDVRQ